ncbi:MAG: hypothetical protein IT331_11510 [Anaerolineae bacterium]|nr:hypothetical protein [Anaerolineae bacterium]
MVLIGLALYATAAQAANDPPVRVFTADAYDVRGGGSASAVDGVINGTTPDTLRTVTTTRLSAGHPHVCVVVASATAQYSAGTGTIFWA